MEEKRRKFVPTVEDWQPLFMVEDDEMSCGLALESSAACMHASF